MRKLKVTEGGVGAPFWSPIPSQPGPLEPLGCAPELLWSAPRLSLFFKGTTQCPPPPEKNLTEECPVPLSQMARSSCVSHLHDSSIREEVALMRQSCVLRLPPASARFRVDDLGGCLFPTPLRGWAPRAWPAETAASCVEAGSGCTQRREAGTTPRAPLTLANIPRDGRSASSAMPGPPPELKADHPRCAGKCFQWDGARRRG